MTDGLTCTDKETLVAYLYGECEAAERRLVESHLATCEDCAQEVAGLSGVRGALTSWKVPGNAAGFRIVLEPAGDSPEAVSSPAIVPESLATPGAAVLRPGRWWQAPLPALGRVAAAILLFAGGAAIANLEVRYDQDGFVVRTGWQRQQPTTPAGEPASSSARASTAAASPWRPDIVSLERRLREEFSGAGASSAGPLEAQGHPALSEAAIIERVRELVAASEQRQREMLASSEQRQQREMAYRISEVTGELAAQRHNDLLMVEQGLGQIQGTTGAEVLQQRQLLNYLLTVSQRR